MNTPNRSDLRSAGYRMTANVDDTIVGRVAEVVKSAYLLHYVTETDIANASATDVIGRAWMGLVFLRYMQEVEFGTRTGGERKKFEYGDHLQEMATIKGDCAMLLKSLAAMHPLNSKIDDVCGVFYRTQLFN